MSLHYLVKLEMLIVHVLQFSCYKKNSGIYRTSAAAPNSPDLNLVERVGNIVEKVYKTRITDLKLSTTPLTNGCRNDDMIQLGPVRSQSLFHLFV